MSISFKGYGENVLTFYTGITEAGIPVSVAQDCMVNKTAADKDFIGITCKGDGEIAGVIVDGYVELPYTGNTPAFGYCNLVANGNGGVKAAASATASNHVVRVINVDTDNKIVGFIL